MTMDENEARFSRSIDCYSYDVAHLPRNDLPIYRRRFSSGNSQGLAVIKPLTERPGVSQRDLARGASGSRLYTIS